MADYTPRQQLILEKLGKTMGFDLNEIVNISLEADIPIAVTYRNNRGQFTRQTYDQLGGILNNDEMSLLKAANAAKNTVNNTAFSTIRSLLGRIPAGTATDFAVSLGRLPNIADISSAFDPAKARLLAAGLTATQSPINSTVVSFANDTEDRVRISDPSNIFINSNNPVLRPLAEVGFVLFPYTPSISMSHTAAYNPENPTHSNYTYPFYQNSPTSTINITGTFTAKDPDSARYVIAVQHFFRSVTKMFYGKDPEAGTPPPVLRLDGHGDYQFSSIPIVITDFNINLPTDVDYISTTIAGETPQRNSNYSPYSFSTGTASQPTNINAKMTRVPVMQDFSITCMPLYSRKSISNEFGLRDFAAGKLLGSPNRGGFI